MQVKRDQNVGKTDYTHYKNITNTCACVESSHYLARFVVCFPIVIKTLLHGFNPYITFHLHCKCATFLGAHTPRNEMKRSIEICLLRGHRRDIYE